MSKHRSRLAALVVGLFALSTNAQAAYFCRGNIAAVALDPNGVVNVFSPGAGLSWVYLCQIGGILNGVSSEACKAIFATLVTAKEVGRPVQWGFNDSLSCGTHPAWGYLTGWYWGPVLLTE